MDTAAVILAGGTAVRMGGTDKGALEYAGSSFLERALAATAAAAEVVVVGDPVQTSRTVTFVREDPPLGGPVAGIVAGRRALTRPSGLLLVQAVDMPLVTPTTYDRLAAAAPGHDGAVLCDPGGRRQLALVVGSDALDRVLPEDPHGRSVHALLATLELAEVPAEDDEACGVDTWRDLARLWDA